MYCGLQIYYIENTLVHECKGEECYTCGGFCWWESGMCFAGLVDEGEILSVAEGDVINVSCNWFES